MIVVDTNVIVYLLIPSDQTRFAEAVARKDPEWAAPSLWRSEMRNVLSLYMRQNKLTIENANSLMQEAEESVANREYDVDSARVLQLAHASGCSAYDCEFVSVAEQLGVELVTSDKKLLAAFPLIAVSMAGFALV